MKRLALHTLGCKLNFAESSTIGRQFAALGFRTVDIDHAADVCIINTCSVTERADRECRQIVRRALRRSPDAFVVVVGCYAQLRPEEIAAIPGVDLVLGSKEKSEIVKHAGAMKKAGTARIVVSPIDGEEGFGTASSTVSSDRTRAFLKIQDGCDYTCTFCTIPLARGVSRSLSVDAAAAQARQLVEEGYKEIVLTGVNVGDYGRKIGADLLGLLRELTTIEGLTRIRISSVEPNLLHDDLIDFWLSTEKICNHFHIPLQSGSNEILKAMRRRYLRDLYAERVHRIKNLAPNAGIGADVIAGFPGETDQLFEETYRFLVELPLSYLHAFTYSERPNTAAAHSSGKVEPRVRFQRSEMLRILSMKKRRAFYETFVGTDVEVLAECEDRKGWMTGLTPEYVRVRFPAPAALANELVRVRISEADHEACTGLPDPTQTSTAAPESIEEREKELVCAT